MKDYEQIEDDLVSVLKDNQSLKSIADITALPDNESELQRNLTKPKVYIVYTGSTFDDPENNNVVIQSERMRFEAIIRSRTRRGAGGILDLLKRIGQLLQGRKMYIGCDPIALDQDGYIDGVQNNFNYVLAFNIVTKSASIVPDPDAEDPANNVYKLKVPEFITE